MSYAQVWRRTADRRGRGRGAGRRRVAAGFALLLAASLAVAGCSGSGSSTDSSKAAEPAMAQKDDGAKAAAPPAVATGGAPATGSGNAAGGSHSSGAPGKKAPAPTTYLIRTADLSVRTPHVADQLATARQYATQAGGYAGDENTTVDPRGHAASTVQLRVPSAQYDTVLSELTGLGQLLKRDTRVKDVTGQVVDVQSRVASQQASVARVRALMNQATDLSDVVSLESELSTRESDLESLEAQQASLKSQTNMATITLRLSEPPVAKSAAPKPKKKHDGFWVTVGHALGDGWHAFYVTLRALLVVLSVTLPFLAVIACGAVAYFFFRRRRRTP